MSADNEAPEHLLREYARGLGHAIDGHRRALLDKPTPKGSRRAYYTAGYNAGLEMLSKRDSFSSESEA